MSLTKRLKRAIFVSYRLKEILRKLSAVQSDLLFLRPREKLLKASPESRSAAMRHAYVKLVATLAPGQVGKFEKARFGSIHDGGYVMLDHLENIAAVYSLGIGQNISWDYEMARRNIPVYQFDDSINHLPYSHPLFHFSPLRIGGAADESQNVIDIEGITSKLHHQGKDLILKVDIEGSEWEVFEKIKPEVLAQFRQIVCEFHGLTSCLMDGAWLDRAARSLTNLTRLHRVIHVHANNVVPPLLADNTILADILEVTLVRADSYELTDSFEMFPGPLDSPNIPGEEDICLGTFRY